MAKKWKDILCCKVMESLRGGNKKKTEVNWPELDTYCGCCTLSTGIFIRSIGSLVMTIVFIAINATMLGHILKVKLPMSISNITIEDNFLGLNATYNENDLEKYRQVRTFLIAYYSLWLVYKTIYVISLLWTLPAFLKGSHKILKILMYVSIPNLVLDIFISFLTTIMVYNSLLLRISLILCILCEGYNILAMSSEYKRRTGKLKPRHKDIEREVNTQTLSDLRDTAHGEFTFTTPHCRTCKCYEPVQSLQPVRTPQTPHLIQSDTAPLLNKQIYDFELNYAITGVLNVDDIAAETSTKNIRPNTLDLKLNTTDDEKILVTDEPVIYDVEQLNIGTSPVIENKKTLNLT